MFSNLLYIEHTKNIKWLIQDIKLSHFCTTHVNIVMWKQTDEI